MLYAKDQDPKSVIDAFFHEDYSQSINGVFLNKDEYIQRVIEQRRHIQTMAFECKIDMSQNNQLFMIYDTKGTNTQGDELIAEVIAYFEFKDQKIFKTHGQVHLRKGNPSDIDMSEE